MVPEKRPREVRRCAQYVDQGVVMENWRRDLRTISGREKLFSALNPTELSQFSKPVVRINNFLIYANHLEKCLAHSSSSVYVYYYIYQSEVYTSEVYHYIGKLSGVCIIGLLATTPQIFKFSPFSITFSLKVLLSSQLGCTCLTQ